MTVKLETDRTKNIKVLSTVDNSVLFEGPSSETKVQLKSRFGEDITVQYLQQYTSISAGESYSEALSNPQNVNGFFYTEAEFLSFYEKSHDLILWAYSERDLQKKLGVNKKKETKTKQHNKIRNKVYSGTPNLSAFLFTSMTDLEGEEFPINGITKEQVLAAKSSLEEEDYALAEYANANSLSINDEAVKKQQIEVCIFITGTVKGLESYITNTGVKWIGSNERKGLIKNTVSSTTGQQTILLIIDVRLKPNKTILTQLGYF